MHGHSQKVADVFINNRIPVYQRKTWPLLINKEKIIWIPGLRQCDDTKVSSETREVLIIELVRNKIGQTDSSSF
jgi:tRNA(Ile)-lysidine synthase